MDFSILFIIAMDCDQMIPEAKESQILFPSFQENIYEVGNSIFCMPAKDFNCVKMCVSTNRGLVRCEPAERSPAPLGTALPLCFEGKYLPLPALNTSQPPKDPVRTGRIAKQMIRPNPCHPKGRFVPFSKENGALSLTPSLQAENHSSP